MLVYPIAIAYVHQTAPSPQTTRRLVAPEDRAAFVETLIDLQVTRCARRVREIVKFLNLASGGIELLTMEARPVDVRPDGAPVGLLIRLERCPPSKYVSASGHHRISHSFRPVAQQPPPHAPSGTPPPCMRQGTAKGASHPSAACPHSTVPAHEPPAPTLTHPLHAHATGALAESNGGTAGGSSISIIIPGAATIPPLAALALRGGSKRAGLRRPLRRRAHHPLQAPVGPPARARRGHCPAVAPLGREAAALALWVDAAGGRADPDPAARCPAAAVAVGHQHRRTSALGGRGRWGDGSTGQP